MGLRSPLLPLGIAAPSVTEQGGFVTLPWWRGGSTPTTEQGGYITLPWWQGGGDVGVTPVVAAQKGGVTRRTRKRRRDELYDEEEEELAIIYALISTGHIKH